MSDEPDDRSSRRTRPNPSLVDLVAATATGEGLTLRRPAGRRNQRRRYVRCYDTPEAGVARPPAPTPAPWLVGTAAAGGTEPVGAGPPTRARRDAVLAGRSPGLRRPDRVVERRKVRGGWVVVRQVDRDVPGMVATYYVEFHAEQ